MKPHPITQGASSDRLRRPCTIVHDAPGFLETELSQNQRALGDTAHHYFTLRGPQKGIAYTSKPRAIDDIKGRNHWTGDCSHSCGHVFASLENCIQLHIDIGTTNSNFSTVWDGMQFHDWVMYKGLQYLITICTYILFIWLKAWGLWREDYRN